MPSAAGEIGFAQAERMGGLPKRGAHGGVAADRLAVGQRSERPPLHARHCSVRRALAFNRVDETRCQRRIGGARVDHQAAAAGDDIGGAWLDGEDADGGDEIAFAFTRQLLGYATHGSNGIGRGDQRVLAQRHRRGAGVVGGALKHDLDAPDADDRGDDADIERLGFQYDALFDVQFEEGAHVRTLRLGQPIRIAADLAQRIAQGFAAGIGQVEHRRIESSGHTAAADAGQTIFARLLGEKIDDLDGVT